jgi:hypothetical protein
MKVALIAAIGAAGALAVAAVPEIKRYLKVRSM